MAKRRSEATRNFLCFPFSLSPRFPAVSLPLHHFFIHSVIIDHARRVNGKSHHDKLLACFNRYTEFHRPRPRRIRSGRVSCLIFLPRPRRRHVISFSAGYLAGLPSSLFNFIRKMEIQKDEGADASFRSLYYTYMPFYSPAKPKSLNFHYTDAQFSKVQRETNFRAI